MYNDHIPCFCLWIPLTTSPNFHRYPNNLISLMHYSDASYPTSCLPKMSKPTHLHHLPYSTIPWTFTLSVQPTDAPHNKQKRLSAILREIHPFPLYQRKRRWYRVNLPWSVHHSRRRAMQQLHGSLKCLNFGLSTHYLGGRCGRIMQMRALNQ